MVKFYTHLDELASAYTFDLVHSFTGHSGPVESLSWATDSVLFTAGLDGNIYGWTLIHCARIDNFNVLRNFGVCTALVTTFRQKRFEAAACTSNGAVHKLIWNGNPSEDCQTFLINKPNSNGSATSLCFSIDDKFLFTGTKQGKILIYDWDPAGSASNCKREIALHNISPYSDEVLNSVKCITVSKDRTIISAGGSDGSLFISSMKASKQELTESLDSQKEVLGLGINAYQTVIPSTKPLSKSCHLFIQFSMVFNPVTKHFLKTVFCVVLRRV